MPKLVGLFLSRRYRNGFTAIVAILAFLLFAGAFLAIGLQRLEATVEAEAKEALADFERTERSIVHALGILQEHATGLVCGDAMQAEMRRVAFIPDGLNEFFFAPDGAALCSANVAVFGTAHRFGSPDAGADGRLPFEMWFSQDLSFAGYSNLVGGVARRGDFAVVLRAPETQRLLPSWLRLESVLVGDTGRVAPFNGTAGVYETALAETSSSLLTTHRIICDADAFHCIGTETDVIQGLAADPLHLGAGLTLAAILAAGTGAWGRRSLVRHFSFEARFVRHLDAQSLICVYQPILEVASGRIIGCEVLARWRDIDDTLVMPDHFIKIVERRGMTLAFTRLVIEKAHAELSRHMPAERHLQVNVNIFPADIGKPGLPDVFASFLAEPNRFGPVAEIVETEALDIQTAQLQIEMLRRRGVRTYIDDFGCGYSNIQTLAALAVDGVKLDRSFAMAPEGSVMERMLCHAIDMVKAAGRMIVVEGVETAERLEALRTDAVAIDYAQGYHISRPLLIESFAVLSDRSLQCTPLNRAA